MLDCDFSDAQDTPQYAYIFAKLAVIFMKLKGRDQIVIFAAIIILIGIAVSTVYMMGGSSTSKSKVLLITSMGNITIQLYDDMPITTGNFKNLVNQGVYDGVLFYRVEQDFVIQAGPAGSGRTGSIPTIKDEFTSHNRNFRGTIAMAKTSAANSATSEFFINLKDNGNGLDGTFDSTYSVFGEVTNGMDIVDKIGNVQTVLNKASGMHTPVQQVQIIRAELIN